MRADIEAVVFDLDGTLLDRRRSFERFVQGQWERFANSLQTADQEQYVQTLVELDRDGYAPRKLLFTGVVARFEIPSGVAETLLDDYRAGFPNACMLFPDAAQTLSCLRTSGLKLGLITNGSIRMQSRKLQCLALAPMFDTILISDAEGVSKPDPQIFHRALERLGISPARSVFVGDHPEVDVAGARAAGMQAIWHRDPSVSRIVEADGVIEELGDLLAWLGLGRTGFSYGPRLSMPGCDSRELSEVKRILADRRHGGFDQLLLHLEFLAVAQVAAGRFLRRPGTCAWPHRRRTRLDNDLDVTSERDKEPPALIGAKTGEPNATRADIFA